MEAFALPVLASSTGILSHLLYFNRGEHHFYPLRYPLIFVAVYLIGIGLYTQYAAVPLSRSLSGVTSLGYWYLTGLYSSMVVYRLFLSPLHNYPGPFSTKLFALGFTFRVHKLNAHKHVEHLHQQYGAFVRTGPNSLSIAHPKAMQAVYGHGSKCSKAPFYDMTYPNTSLAHIRPLDTHAKRRRLWSAVFGEKALRNYETRIRGYQTLLLQRLAETNGKPFTINEWLAWYASDVMSDLAFGESFGSLEASRPHWIIEVLERGNFVFGLMLPMWLFRFLGSLHLNDDFDRLTASCNRMLDERMKV